MGINRWDIILEKGDFGVSSHLLFTQGGGGGEGGGKKGKDPIGEREVQSGGDLGF